MEARLARERRTTAAETDTPYAWARLAVAVLLCTIGSVGMWSVVVALPAVQTEFGVARGAASLPYALTMAGFGAGGVLMGRLADRFGAAVPVAAGAVMLGLGFAAASLSGGLAPFALAQGALIGVGSSATFAPLIADTSLWFARHRGTAVALCAAGNYLAGAVWPPLLQRAMAAWGWRAAHLGIGLLCLATMLPLSLVLRPRAPRGAGAVPGASAARSASPGALGLSPGALQTLLAAAGVACCVAMAMPQAHIVAYCGDLGYGVARGAQMLSLMLACGIVSRVLSGFVADRIGGLPTLAIGSALQGLALLLYLGATGLTPLYVVSALFGLFQGGIVPSYAIIVREYFPPAEAGTRTGVVIMATLAGMALGGWMSGAIFDLTGSYRAAFANGVAWNALNGVIVLFLLLRARRGGGRRLAAA